MEYRTGMIQNAVLQKNVSYKMDIIVEGNKCLAMPPPSPT